MVQDEYIMYHKPNCATSLEVLKTLKNQFGIRPQLFLYLETPPTPAALAKLVKKLAIKPFALVRTKEKLYKELFEGQDYTDKEWLKLLSENPILIDRPILIKGNKAIIAKPADALPELLKGLD